LDKETSKGYDLILVTGPTASGKTSLAVALANRLKGEVISADSRQVYRGMDIGTGKDYDDYIIDGERIPCHLIDIAEPGYKYNVFEYQRDFFKVYKSLKERKVFPVVCGGSGMYADSIIKGYKMIEVPPDSGLRTRLEKKSLEELTGILSSMKNLHNVTDVDTKKRAIRAIEIEHYSRNKKANRSQMPELNSLVIGVSLDRDVRRRRITERLRKRLESGMIEEVEGLLKKGIDPDMLVYYGLEYKYITLYLQGQLSYEKMANDLEVAIHQFAKRQMTWFRGMEKKGTRIHWIDGELLMDEKINKVFDLMKVENLQLST
jgi:tRNA dimethylallyltransferase